MPFPTIDAPGRNLVQYRLLESRSDPNGVRPLRCLSPRNVDKERELDPNPERRLGRDDISLLDCEVPGGVPALQRFYRNLPLFQPKGVGKG